MVDSIDASAKSSVAEGGEVRCLGGTTTCNGAGLILPAPGFGESAAGHGRFSSPEEPWIRSMRALNDWKSSAAAGEGTSIVAAALRCVFFKPELVRVGLLQGLETTVLGVNDAVSWVLVGVLGFAWLAWNSSWIGESRAICCALWVSATLTSRLRVVPARFDTAPVDVDGVSGPGGPRSCSKVVQGPLDAGRDAGWLTTRGAGGAVA